MQTLANVMNINSSLVNVPSVNSDGILTVVVPVGADVASAINTTAFLQTIQQNGFPEATQVVIYTPSEFALISGDRVTMGWILGAASVGLVLAAVFAWVSHSTASGAPPFAPPRVVGVANRHFLKI